MPFRSETAVTPDFRTQGRHRGIRFNLLPQVFVEHTQLARSPVLFR
jgi:hypothetical protein